MTARYAANTEVSSDRSIAEIRRTLSRYKADQFAYLENQEHGAIAFVIYDRQVRFVVPLPDRTSREFTMSPTGRARTSSAAEAAYEQAIKQRWRALALVVKAKLEAVETGIVTFDQEFAMHMVLPDGSMVADQVLPGIAQAYLTGVVRPLLQIGTGS